MEGFYGTAFLLGIQHLDTASRELFDNSPNNHRRGLPLEERSLDPATVRLVGAAHHFDPHAIERLR